MTCQHEWAWDLRGCNEDGWRCCACNYRPGEPAGYSPTLDRLELDVKVGDIQMAMYNSELTYFSNAVHGDSVTDQVVRQCRELGQYDQRTIAILILDAGHSSHAKYWRELGDAIVAGNDPRTRCNCGALATSFGRIAVCSECSEKRAELF